MHILVTRYLKSLFSFWNLKTEHTSNPAYFEVTFFKLTLKKMQLICFDDLITHLSLKFGVHFVFDLGFGDYLGMYYLDYIDPSFKNTNYFLQKLTK